MSFTSDNIGTIVNQLPIPDLDATTLEFTVSNGAIVAGQEVILHTDGTARPRTAGTQYPIGYAVDSAAIGAKIRVATVFKAVKVGINGTGGTVNAGVFLKPNNTVVGGLDTYVAVAASDFVFAITLESTTTGLNTRVGLLETPFKN